MTAAQHLNDLIESQRRLMWALPPAERAHRLAEVRADYEYENELEAVAEAMAEEEIAEEVEGARGGMFVVVITEFAVICAVVAVAIFWSGIGTGAI